MRIGVFDSGIGGEAVALALQTHFPKATITTVNDRAHLPYGNKTTDEIQQLTNIAIQPLLGNDIIVIACNSATAAAIDWLRQAYPDQLFIGLEPMVKPAAEATTSGVIAICATPATLASRRYHDLKEHYGAGVTILEPDCSLWATLIEENRMNESMLRTQITDLLKQSADVIVLGCTHYHWIKEEIIQIVNSQARVLDPSDAIADRVKNLLNLAG